ncbi:actin family protein, putative [Babesia ovis]|uniref:Actin family protein, putative n=1 Tax=Babesia ovis TaxID=5869 RepID=A0A9W5T9A7_BABOV|nr:actin family protein, putative [Babesia ovis]
MDPAAYVALPRIVLDNGSGSLKFSMASSNKPPTILPNCIGQPKRKFTNQSFHEGSSNVASDDHVDAIGDGCYNLSEYFCLRPFSDALLYEPARQRTIWKKVMGNPHLLINGTPANLLGVNPATTAICITEPNMCPSMCRQTMAEMIFEDLGFSMAAIITSQAASNWYYTNAVKQAAQDHGTKHAGVSPDLVLNTLSDSGFTSGGNRKLPTTQSCLVVDCGFGAMHCVPFVEGRPIQRAALRSSLGGYHLNAYMKNISAIRTINLEFNELLVQHMKEEVCYVSSDFDLEMMAASTLRTVRGHTVLQQSYKIPIYTAKNKSQIHRHFNTHGPMAEPLLTDARRTVVEKLAKNEQLDETDMSLLGVQLEADEAGSHNSGGESARSKENDEVPTTEDHPKDDKKNANQVVTLTTERFAVPEILFSPQDLHIRECGITELVHRTIALSPPCIQKQLASNILLTGGSTKFYGFPERLHMELRKLLPAEWDLQIHFGPDRGLTAFHGARLFARDDTVFLENAVTRNYYLEHGGIYPRR